MGNSFRLGLGTAVSSDGSEPGMIKIEISVAAAVWDEKGTVRDMAADSVKVQIPAVRGTVAGTDKTAVFRSRYELRDEEQFPENERWCADADKLRENMIGKSRDEGRQTAEQGKCSLLEEAVLAALTDPETVSFSGELSQLRLAVGAGVNGCVKNASFAASGALSITARLAAAATDRDGRILAVQTDGLEPAVFFDRDGKVVQMISEGSMRQRKLDWWNLKVSAAAVGMSGEEIKTEDTAGTPGEDGQKEKVLGEYLALAVQASARKDYFRINGKWYRKGETAEIFVSDPEENQFAAFRSGDVIRYRLLEADERRSGKILVEAVRNLDVKFYRYGLFIDGRCVIAGDSEMNRILLTDYLPDSRKNSYCFGYDSSNGNGETDGSGCICAANDLWKVFHIRYINTGYCQVNLSAENGETIRMQNSEKAYQAAPIPPGAAFPFCDADNPRHLPPSGEGQAVEPGTYYVKPGTRFTDGVTVREVSENISLRF